MLSLTPKKKNPSPKSWKEPEIMLIIVSDSEIDYEEIEQMFDLKKIIDKISFLLCKRETMKVIE